MAEAWACELLPASLKVHSAGSKPGALNPWAVRLMQEVGAAPSTHRAKGLRGVPVAEVDLAIALCLEEICPELPLSLRRESWATPDPARTAADEAALGQARHEIKGKVEELTAR